MMSGTSGGWASPVPPWTPRPTSTAPHLRPHPDLSSLHGAVMMPPLAAVAAAIDREPDPQRRAALEGLALDLMLLRILDWQIHRVRARLCRLALDDRRDGGDDDRRDAAAA